MQQAEIHQYLKNFFHATQCPILNETKDYLDVQLTIDMDKKLMNRPFYWHYLEKTNGQPNPMQVTFITTPTFEEKEKKAEYMHYGSRRLHQIFAVAKELGSYIRLYEHLNIPSSTTNAPLYPWLGINLIVTLQCDRKKDILYSIGLNLINGTIIEDFQTKMEHLHLVPKIPDLSFTMSPIISVANGLKRIEETIVHTQSLEEHNWAKEAIMRLKNEETLLNHFYEDLEEFPESYHTEKEALYEQYSPLIKLSIINGGLFYLSAITNKNFLTE